MDEGLSDMLLWALLLGAAQTCGAIIVDKIRQRDGTDPAAAIAHILDEQLVRIADVMESLTIISGATSADEETEGQPRKRSRK